MSAMPQVPRQHLVQSDIEIDPQHLQDGKGWIVTASLHIRKPPSRRGGGVGARLIDQLVDYECGGGGDCHEVL